MRQGNYSEAEEYFLESLKVNDEMGSDLGKAYIFNALGKLARNEKGRYFLSEVTSVLNGTLVEILSEKPENVNGYLWLRVRIPGGPEGWMLQSVLLAATPAPNW